MQVTVKLYGALRRYRPAEAGGAPHHPFSFSLAEGATVADLAAALAIGEGQVTGAAVDGQAVAADAPLHDGSQVSLFPPAAGG